MKLLRRANGEKSTSVTILWLSWGVSIFLILLSMLDIDKSIFGFSIRPVDPSIILFLLAPTGILYGWRRQADAKQITDTMERLEK